MRTTSVAHRVLRSVVMVCLVACAESPTEQRQDDLATARARWRTGGLTGYDFELQRLCYCPDETVRPVTVSVRGSAFAGLAHTDDGTAADTVWFRDFLTMERVFEYLERTVAERPAVFMATYDAVLGYPVSVELDGDRQVADDELWLEIPALRPVTP